MDCRDKLQEIQNDKGPVDDENTEDNTMRETGNYKAFRGREKYSDKKTE